MRAFASGWLSVLVWLAFRRHGKLKLLDALHPCLAMMTLAVLCALLHRVGWLALGVSFVCSMQSYLLGLPGMLVVVWCGVLVAWSVLMSQSNMSVHSNSNVLWTDPTCVDVLIQSSGFVCCVDQSGFSFLNIIDKLCLVRLKKLLAAFLTRFRRTHREAATPLGAS